MNMQTGVLDTQHTEPRMRAGEAERTWFRSERIFCINGGWYFCSREEGAHGPFPDRKEAEAALIHFLRDMAMVNQRVHH